MLYHRKRRAPLFHEFETKHVDVKRHRDIYIADEVSNNGHVSFISTALGGDQDFETAVDHALGVEGRLVGTFYILRRVRA
jgi:hypothetical protein